MTVRIAGRLGRCGRAHRAWRGRADDVHDLGVVEHLARLELGGELVELLPILFQQLRGPHGRLTQHAGDFIIDDLRRVLAELALLIDVAAEERVFVGTLTGHRPQLFAHAPVGHHLPGDPRGLREVVFRAGRVFAEDEFLSRSPAQDEDEAVVKIGLADVHPVFLRDELGHAKGPATRNDRHLVEFVDTREKPGGEGMPGLVVGGHLLLATGEHFFGPINTLSRA